MLFGLLTRDRDDRLEEIVREAVTEAMRQQNRELKARLAATKDVTKLREELETLRIEKARKEEDFDRREREVEHKVGLERKRQQFEVDQAKRETTVGIREENVKADRKRFEEQMRFHEERFKEEVKYLKRMVAQVLERLPSAEIIANVGGD